MGNLTAYELIEIASIVIILSFFFGELSRKTNIPSVLMLIVLGIGMKFIMDIFQIKNLDFMPVLEILGIIGLIMIVLEAALELKLTRDKLWPIFNALIVALIGLLASTWLAVIIIQYFLPDISTLSAWLYATPLSILSSAIIIPSVSGLNERKKEFHIYESTFSDILGIMLFYFLADQVPSENHHSTSVSEFFIFLFLTVAISFIAGYALILIFQKIRTQVKLFLLIAVLLMLYAVGKQWHLSSLLLILTFGLIIGNIQIFFQGKLSKWLDLSKAKQIYQDLHIVTMETAFVVRTFFFVIFGITINLASLASLQVAAISGLILLSIYVIRFIMLRVFVGSDIIPQIFVAPRGLITVLLFFNIPQQATINEFEPGILLFIIIATSLVMTFALIYDKNRTFSAIKKAQIINIGYSKWKAPSIESIAKDETENQSSN